MGWSLWSPKAGSNKSECKGNILWGHKSVETTWFHIYPSGRWLQTSLISKIFHILFPKLMVELTLWYLASCTTSSCPLPPCRTWTSQDRGHWSPSRRNPRCSQTPMAGLELQQQKEKEREMRQNSCNNESSIRAMWGDVNWVITLFSFIEKIQKDFQSSGGSLQGSIRIIRNMLVRKTRSCPGNAYSYRSISSLLGCYFHQEKILICSRIQIPFVYFRDACKQPLNVEADRSHPAGLQAECNTTEQFYSKRERERELRNGRERPSWNKQVVF